jgi:thioredoxin-related protein
MERIMVKTLGLLVLGLMIANLRAEPTWITSVDQAKQQAQKENKVVLLDFTGSDWCGYCIKLKNAVWSKPEFAKFAEKNLVLVEVDFPRKTKLPAALQRANDKLGSKYNIEGYPTVVVLDAQGKKLGAIEGYDDESPSQYIAKLEKIMATAKK